MKASLLSFLALGLAVVDSARAANCKPASVTSSSSSSAPAGPTCYPGPNIVTNSNFDPDIDGWSTAGDFSGSANFGPGPITSSIQLNADSNKQAFASFSQTVPTTNVGSSYILSFDFYIAQITPGSTLVCSFDSVARSVTPLDVLTTWTKFSQTYTAYSATTQILCKLVIPKGTENVDKIFVSNFQVYQCFAPQ